MLGQCILLHDDMWSRICWLKKVCSTDEFSKNSDTEQLLRIVKGLVAASKICSRPNHVGYQNESISTVIWKPISKASYVIVSQLQLGVFDVVANFNVGRRVNILIYEFMDIIPSKYTLLE